MWFQYIYRHVGRCVHALGRFGTRRDVNACVASVHEFYVDIFVLQVSNNTGCHFCSIVNVNKKDSKYITEVVTSHIHNLFSVQVHQIIKDLVLCKRREHIYIMFYLTRIYDIHWKYVSVEYTQEYNPYPTAFPYGNGMVLHFYQQQESSTTKTVHKVINKGLKTYV